VDVASEDASFKTVSSISAWWIFPRPVILCSELEDKNRVFHRCLVDFSPTYGFDFRRSCAKQSVP